jgi:hypothetical protein
VEKVFLLSTIKVINFYYLIFNFNKLKIESLFLFGNNDCHQLGVKEVNKIGTIENDILKNLNIDANKIKKISCGSCHNLILIEGSLKNLKKKKINKKKKKIEKIIYLDLEAIKKVS